jgi:hypothetical protein
VNKFCPAEHRTIQNRFIVCRWRFCNVRCQQQGETRRCGGSPVILLQVAHWRLEEGCVSTLEGGEQSWQDNDAVPWRAAWHQQRLGQHSGKGHQLARTVRCPCIRHPDQGSECLQCLAKDAVGQRRACTSSPPLHPPPPPELVWRCLPPILFLRSTFGIANNDNTNDDRAKEEREGEIKHNS